MISAESGRVTVTESTPSTLVSAACTVELQEPHVIPEILREIVWLADGDAAVEGDSSTETSDLQALRQRARPAKPLRMIDVVFMLSLFVMTMSLI